MLIVLESGNLNLLDTSGLVKGCNGIALPFPSHGSFIVSFCVAGNTNKGNNPQSGQPPSQPPPPSQASSSQQQQQPSQQQPSQQQQPQQQSGSTSWAQAAGKGLPANQQANTGGSGSSSSSSSNNNTNPGTGSSGSTGANSNTGSNSTKQQLEQLNTMREALFSQDGWGGVSILQQLPAFKHS
jgi:trinucleotide repeat-containing gene 6 protein